MKGVRTRTLLTWAIALSVPAASGVLVVSWLRRAPEPIRQGQAAYDRGEYPEATRLAREILKARPNDSDALRLLARSLGRQGRDDVAQGIYGRLGDEAMRGEDFLVLAQGLIRQNQLEPALGVLEAGRRADPRGGEALHELARLNARLRFFDPALDAARDLARLPGWEARGSLIVGLVSLEQEDYETSAEALERALRADPTLEGGGLSPESIRRVLAQMFLRVGKPESARAILGTLDEADGDDDRERAWLLSRAWLQEGRLDRAEEALARSGSLRDDDPLRPEPSRFVGADRCAECHREIHAAEQSSRHARTLYRPDDLTDLELPREPLRDPVDPAITHAFTRDGESIRVETTIHDESYRALVEYALGSGDRGLSLIGRDDQGTPRVLRMSLYEDRSLWDLTAQATPRPENHREYLGRTLNDEALTLCLRCHMTSLHAARDPEAPEAADRGIGCERCHGPGENHILAVRSGFPDLAIARPILADADQITNLCAQCHSGDDPSISPSDARFVRFQTRTMVESPCYTRSEGRLSCVTCHDPHHNAETSPAFYEAKCLGCHSPSTESVAEAVSHGTRGRTRPASLPDDIPRVACPVNPAGDCLSCHMPQDHQAAPHTTFTDHHIRIHREPLSASGALRR